MYRKIYIILYRKIIMQSEILKLLKFIRGNNYAIRNNQIY